jgi:hypothetical protein
MILLLAAKLAAPYLGSICWLVPWMMAVQRGGYDCEPVLVHDVRDGGGVIWSWGFDACGEDSREVYYRVPAVQCAHVTCSAKECSK